MNRASGKGAPKMRLLTRVTAAILLLTAGLIVLPVAPALAAGSPAITVLPLDRVAEVELDQAGGHLFVSAGPGRDEVLVTDLAGVGVRELHGLPGASGMLLDGGTLYVALRDAGAIAAIDSVSLEETRRFAMPAGICPDELAKTAGRLVFTAPNCDPQFSEAKLGVLDPATGQIASIDTLNFAPTIAANPASGGLVAVAATGISQSNVAVYDVGGGTPVPLRSTTEGRTVSDLALSPDGNSLFVSGNRAGEFLPLSTLAWGRLVTSSNVAAWSGDGSRLVVSDAEEISVWPAGTTATSSAFLTPNGIDARHRRLVSDEGAARAWVVSKGPFSTDPVQLVGYDLASTGTAWTLSSARTVVPELTPVTLTANLSVGGAPVADGVRLVVLIDRPDGTGTAEERFTRDGGVSYSVLAERGVTTYRFSYSDATNGAALAYAEIVGTFQTLLTALDPRSPSNPGQPLNWFAQLTDTDGRALPFERIELTRDGVVVNVGRTDPSGYVQLTDTPDQTGTFQYVLRWAGTEAGAPAQHETVIAVEKYTGGVGVNATLGSGRTGRTATVQAVLGDWHTNRSITITAQPDGGTATVIAQGDVADDHTLTVTYRLRKATTFTVSYDGDDWYTAAEASIRLTLH
jgi:hypothetical protein